MRRKPSGRRSSPPWRNSSPKRRWSSNPANKHSIPTLLPSSSARLAVPGASLYYEVRGSGPVLLMMPGGPADAGAFRRIAEPLASDYTVVTYDPRGLSHSPLDGPIQDERIVQTAADDVHRLLAAITKEPAFVFA